MPSIVIPNPPQADEESLLNRNGMSTVGIPRFAWNDKQKASSPAQPTPATQSLINPS